MAAVPDNEWYTPQEIIEFARNVMGSIDLDPFSTPKANETVKAKTFYTIADNGFTKHWSGNVWLNPPFSAGMMAKVMSRLIEYEPKPAMMLCNFDPSTRWCHQAMGWFNVVGFFKSRLRFIPGAGQREAFGPKRAQALFLRGSWRQRQDFVESFARLGISIELRSIAS